jgi:hypothetical protein
MFPDPLFMKRVQKTAKPIKEDPIEERLPKSTRSQKQEGIKIITVEIRNNNADFNSTRIA